MDIACTILNLSKDLNILANSFLSQDTVKLTFQTKDKVKTKDVGIQLLEQIT